MTTYIRAPHDASRMRARQGTPKLATPNQVGFLTNLMKTRRYNDLIPVDEQVKIIEDLFQAEKLTRQAASTMIERALAAPLRDAKPQPNIDDGFYHMNGQIFKVLHAVHGSGRQYAKCLDTETGQFDIARGAIKELALHGEKLTLEKAKELGHIYGRCMCCGATLTDEESIARGIGPVCARKL